jgi:hypothetical protein
MRERGVTFLLALGALAAFYALWMQPLPDLGDDAHSARPTSNERRGNGYSALRDWLQASHVDVRSWRERYTALPDANLMPRGNLLVLTLPGVEGFKHAEFSALDKWVRRGNTLLINAALLDQPAWASGYESGVLVDVESLTSVEFETTKARDERLDDTPLSQRVREADAREAERNKGKNGKNGKNATDEDEDTEDATVQAYEAPEKIELHATGPHALLEGVKTLGLETDFEPKEWSLRMPYDNFVFTLARTGSGEGAVFEQRLGAGRIITVAGGTLFSNRGLGNDDNARFFANLVGIAVAPDGAVLFDDLRQGVSASYNPARFYQDARLWKTVGILLALWFVWVLGSTRLRAPIAAAPDPSEAELVRHAGGLIVRTVDSWNAALTLFDQFFVRVSRTMRGATGAQAPERGELWQWIERHAAIPPQELDQVKAWYADAHSSRKVPLVDLQNLLDKTERRLRT